MATLLDTAQVNPGDGKRWNQGYNAVARECHVHAEFAEACDEVYIPLMGDETSTGPGSYKVVPFPVQGFLRLSVECQASDDLEWFRSAFKDLAELAITRALVIQAVAGVETWVGDTAAQSVVLAANPTDAQLQTALAQARNLWVTTVAGGKPILHVPPSMVFGLVRIGALVPSDGDLISPLGDKVVIGSGYDIAAPHIFYSGEIIVRLTEPSDDGLVYQARINNVTIPIDQLAAIDVAPCSIVRLGV